LEIVLTPLARERLDYHNITMQSKDEIRKISAALSAENGIKINTSFLDKYDSGDFWFIEDMSDSLPNK
jgi:hypothetical protein